MHGEGGNTGTIKKTIRSCSDQTDKRKSTTFSVSPLGPQCLSSQFDLESKLWRWRRPRNHNWLGFRGLGKAVVLPLVLLVFFVFPFVNAVQAGAAFTWRGHKENTNKCKKYEQTTQLVLLLNQNGWNDC